MRFVVLLTALFSPFVRPAAAQSPARPLTVRGVTVSGSVRTRVYDWRWFGDDADGAYTYPGTLLRTGLARANKTWDWQLEFALPIVLNLPAAAVKPGAQGQLGFGGTYFAANDNRTSPAALFVKQGVIRFTRLAGVDGQSIKVGRLEFNDGAERTPKHAALAALKRDRISQRLLGAFGFSDVGRSIDGALYSLDRPALTVTALAGRPTQGVFQVDGWRDLRANLFYGAVTRPIDTPTTAAEWRVFALGYHDYRDRVVKTDNRPLAVRTGDLASTTIGTYGGHYLHVAPVPGGVVDLLVWGVVQNGSWGALAHRARAIAAEAGWQPRGLDALKPWVRLGYDRGSGDDDPGDLTHRTFFQVLPTPRIYARFPFFNMMNTTDAFGEAIVRPAAGLTIRVDAHALRLSTRNDLWYSGGGAFQPATFGFAGRPANGRRGLAMLFDASADYRITPRLALGLYYGHAAARPVTEAIYATGTRAHFAYAEALLGF